MRGCVILVTSLATRHLIESDLLEQGKTNVSHIRGVVSHVPFSLKTHVAKPAMMLFSLGYHLFEDVFDRHDLVDQTNALRAGHRAD